jgi:hypothetical protein
LIAGAGLLAKFAVENKQLDKLAHGLTLGELSLRAIQRTFEILGVRK